jgi:hypothetical protein
LRSIHHFQNGRIEASLHNGRGAALRRPVGAARRPYLIT